MRQYEKYCDHDGCVYVLNFDHILMRLSLIKSNDLFFQESNMYTSDICEKLKKDESTDILTLYCCNKVTCIPVSYFDHTLRLLKITKASRNFFSATDFKRSNTVCNVLRGGDER
jgi:hypothetical protein